MSSMKKALVAIIFATAHQVCAVFAGSKSAVRGANPANEQGIMKKIDFKHKLLLCNAYPDAHKIAVTRNSDAIITADHGIAFRECRYVDNMHLQQRDKLSFEVEQTGISGTFQVGELPNTDAVLLLVLEKRDTWSKLVSFQSFAFPKVSGQSQKDAQVAIIDTFRGNSTRPLLKMEDHITEKEKQTVSRRVELLNFNRVYAIEEGRYDASINDNLSEEETSSLTTKASRMMLHLAHGENYVVLRTGDGSHEQGLTVFPSFKANSAGFGPGLMAFLLMVSILRI